LLDTICLTIVRGNGDGNIDTKQKIKSTALDLFSQKGFSAVSIRDICGSVGIKESTVYYHFKDKKDIFQTLLHDVEQITDAIQIAFNQEISKIQAVEEGPFISVGLGFLNNYLLDEQILKFIRMLMIEQHVNGDAAKLYHRVLFEAPLQQNAAVFRNLMRMGCFASGDSIYLAEEYYAAVFYIFQRYFSSGEVTQEKRHEANERLTAHLKCFYQKYSIIQNV
jgi:AcrR family transcriptional regulator